MPRVTWLAGSRVWARTQGDSLPGWCFLAPPWQCRVVVTWVGRMGIWPPPSNAPVGAHDLTDLVCEAHGCLPDTELRISSFYPHGHPVRKSYSVLNSHEAPGAPGACPPPPALPGSPLNQGARTKTKASALYNDPEKLVTLRVLTSHLKDEKTLSSVFLTWGSVLSP